MTLLVLLLAGLVPASLGSICCPPEQWEAYQFISRVDSNGGYEGLQAVSYDAVSRRYAVFGNYTEGQYADFKVIYDYAAGVEYRITPGSRSCETIAITEKFKDTCVPDGAALMGPFTFGLGRTTLDTRGYRYSTKNKGVTTDVTMVVQRDRCVPVIINTITAASTGDSLVSIGYNNMSPGIRDVTVFSPPAYCGKVKQM
ncbi:ependymin-related protein 1-like [Haliotis rufescens]|uniref:ependymin-related protein 1-like n=1 Tax=Haliotis rufescens TaxID=6454 RepID=UPI001EB03EDF|nr:ependymin-related protein 1-like [Haliotis rufescens]